ncbi:hypothetical protein Tco_0682085 [Tanacetum coccineum]|uniref:Secreted protein n=1 Tax=Tanacetum coccineum TaxID=301880 RepID=A0ABQ4XR24_9ASTR
MSVCGCETLLNVSMVVAIDFCVHVKNSYVQQPDASSGRPACISQRNEIRPRMDICIVQPKVWGSLQRTPRSGHETSD